MSPDEANWDQTRASLGAKAVGTTMFVLGQTDLHPAPRAPQPATESLAEAGLTTSTFKDRHEDKIREYRLCLYKCNTLIDVDSCDCGACGVSAPAPGEQQIIMSFLWARAGRGAHGTPRRKLSACSFIKWVHSTAPEKERRWAALSSSSAGESIVSHLGSLRTRSCPAGDVCHPGVLCCLV